MLVMADSQPKNAKSESTAWSTALRCIIGSEFFWNFLAGRRGGESGTCNGAEVDSAAGARLSNR